MGVLMSKGFKIFKNNLLDKEVDTTVATKKSFQSFLNETTQYLSEESTAVSTALETVLGVAYQAVHQKDPLKSKTLTKAMSSKPFKTAAKYWQLKDKSTKARKEEIDNLTVFGNKIKTEIKGNGTFKFQSKGTITADWKKWGGRNNTSKTDIIIGGKNCSVKNANGAQLMSAKKGEATATVNAAADSNLIEKARIEIANSLGKLEQQTTEGYYASVERLKILKDEGKAGETLFAFATREKKKYEKDLAAWEKAYKAKKATKSEKPFIKKDILDVANNPEKAKKQKTKIDGVNEQFLKDIETKFQANASNALKTLEKYFKKNQKFKLAFVHEAASGLAKFGGTEQTADTMLCWQPSKSGVQDFKIKVHSLKKGPSSPIIKEYASKMDVNVNWKSSSAAKHLGYNTYQNLRLGIRKVTEKQKEQANEHYNEVDYYRQQLNEGFLDEGAFWNKVKELTTKFINKAKELWQRFVEMFGVVIQKIKEAAQDGIGALSNILGFEMITQTNADKNIKIRI